MIQLEIGPGDNAQFIADVEAILNGIAVRQSPAHLIVVKIDNWFDVKWLYFSGKVLGALPVWLNNTPIPPFVPNRVVSQRDFRGNPIEEVPVAFPLHRKIESNEATRRSIKNRYPDILPVWYSGGSETSGRGSMMAYFNIGDDIRGFYVGWQNTPQWHATHHRGVSPQELAELRELGAPAVL